MKNIFNKESLISVGKVSLTPLISAAIASVSVLSLPNHAYSATIFRGCFASGPNLSDGSASGEFNGDVDTITAALIGTGSWQAGNTTKLKNGNRAAIETCVNNAKAASVPGDEFVFYFAGHGGDIIPDVAEPGEGGGSDNHIRIGNTAGGAADRITDDQLATLLSGFKKSVTMSVILDSCYSHTFFDGANDLGSVTQVNGAPVPAGDHLALVAASSPATPCIRKGFTDRLAEGLMKMGNMYKADTNKDGVITTEEAGKYAKGYVATTGSPRCDEGSCSPPFPSNGQSTHNGPIGCGPLDDVCPIVAETVPEPTSTLSLLALGSLGAASTLKRKQNQKSTEKETTKVG
jgi:hypothetical protein